MQQEPEVLKKLEKIFRQSIETEAEVIENACGGVGVDEVVEKLEESVAEILIEIRRRRKVVKSIINSIIERRAKKPNYTCG